MREHGPRCIPYSGEKAALHKQGGVSENQDLMMMYTELKKDAVGLQRMLKVDGFYTGRIDGIVGPKTRAAQARFEGELAELKAQRPLDSRSEGNLEACAIKLQKPVREWWHKKVLPYAAAHGVVVKIICGFRSDAEQNRLSSAVTHARGGSSFHNYGAAIDLGIFEAGSGAYVTADAPYDALFRACGAPAGCLWGGHFSSLHDAPHYQLAAWGAGIKGLKAYMQS